MASTLFASCAYTVTAAIMATTATTNSFFSIVIVFDYYKNLGKDTTKKTRPPNFLQEKANALKRNAGTGFHSFQGNEII